MECPKCGTPIEPGGKFCPSCGTRVVDAAAVPASEPATAPAAAAAQAPSFDAVPSAAPSASAPSVASTAAPSAKPASTSASTASAVGVSKSASSLSDALHATVQSAVDSYTAVKTDPKPTAAQATSGKGVFFYDTKEVMKYFVPDDCAKERQMRLRCIAAAVLGFVIMFFGGFFVILGLVLAVVAALLAYYYQMRIGSKKGVLTDKDIDAIYKKIGSNVDSEVLEKLGLSKKEAGMTEPLCFSGPSAASSPAKCFSHIGKDGVIRYSNYQSSQLYPGKQAIYYYAAAQSLVYASRQVTTVEIYYNDIVDLKIIENISGKGSNGGTAELHTTAGNTYAIAFRSNERKTIVGLRTLLRQKKEEADTIAREQLRKIEAL